MNPNDEKIEAQLTKYFYRVIHYASINYYKKKIYLMNKEQIVDQLPLEYLGEEIRYISNFPTLFLLDYPLKIEDEHLIDSLNSLDYKEQYFLLEKLIFGKTDKEISKILGISRQGVTNLKLRLYQKIRDRTVRE